MLLTLPSFVSFHVAAGTILPLAMFDVFAERRLFAFPPSLCWYVWPSSPLSLFLFRRGVSGLAEVCYPLDPLFSGT